MGRRKRPKRAERARGLVVTEGCVTEREYLELLKQHLGRDIGSVTIKTVGRDPVSVFKAADKEFHRGEYDWCYCLVDVDEHAHLDKCLQQAARTKICVLVSNPKFEIWLLWHLADAVAHLSGNEVDRQLAKRKAVNGKSLAADFPVHKYQLAAVRAKVADPELTSNRKGPNPSSALPLLVENLGLRVIGN